jgi:hypothetical protein
MAEGSQAETLPVAPSRSRWRRFTVAIVWLCVAAIGLAAGGICYFVHTADRELQEAMSEVEALDPHWLWDDLNAQRVAIPAEKNSALLVIQTAALLPVSWPPKPQQFDPATGQTQNVSLDQLLGQTAPDVQLDGDRLKLVNAALAPVAAAEGKARRLTELPSGSYSIVVPPDLVSMRFDHARAARNLGLVLHLRALLLAQEGKTDAALELARGIMNAGRSIGNEPFSVSQLHRIEIGHLALRTVERVLAQGEPSDAALLAMQRLVEMEAAEYPTLLLQATRGDRAGWHLALTNLAAGRIRASQLAAVSPTRSKGMVNEQIEALCFRKAHPGLLRLLNESVEIARLPMEEQPPRFEDLKATVSTSDVHGADYILNCTLDVFHALRRHQARLRCAATALAAERFRREHSSWPQSLAKLCPTYLAAVPRDPFRLESLPVYSPIFLPVLFDHDRTALQFNRPDFGLIIYSFCVDDLVAASRQPKPDKRPGDVGTDLAFHLWNVDQRRQPSQ